MRKLSLFSAVLSLFLLVPASIIWAQTISSQKGLTTAVFHTSAGIIKVYLPDDMRPGDIISGTIIAQPAGNNQRQVEKNLAELGKYMLSVDGNKYPVPAKAESFKWLVHSDRKLTAPMELLQVNGNKVGQLDLQLKSQDNNLSSSRNCVIPSHALLASPVRITGNFDGDAATTKCSLDNRPLEVLAESPRECLVQSSPDAQGLQTMQVNENGKLICSGPVRAVEMLVSAGKLDLRRGEKTYIDVSISGLQNLPGTAILTLNNVTTGIVSMQPSNNVIIPLVPDSVGSGVFNRQFGIQSTRNGSFTVNVNLDLPEVEAGNPPTQPGDEPKQPKDTTQPQPQPHDSTIAQCPACKCSCSASIIFDGKAGDTLIYRVAVKGSCSGFFGAPPCVECGIVDQVVNDWTISYSADKPITIIGGNKGVFFKFKNPGNGAFLLSIKATVTCSDGSSCTCTDETTGHPPSIPEEPRGKCDCSASCAILKVGTNCGEDHFIADVDARCKSNNPKFKCTVASITYLWFIGEPGKGVAGISGGNDAPRVSVKIKNAGSYTLFLKVTVTCSDGTVCEFTCSKTVTIPDCTLLHEWCAATSIKVKAYGYYPNGDLLNNMRPGELIGLTVYAEDNDVLVQQSICRGVTGFTPHPPVPDEVSYSWEFGGAGGAGKLLKTDGNSITYQLPYCYEKYPVWDEVVVRMKNKGGKADDEEVVLVFSIVLKVDVNGYNDELSVGQGNAVPLRTIIATITPYIVNKPEDIVCRNSQGCCTAVLPATWEKGNDLKISTLAPLREYVVDKFPDNMVVLTANGTDADDVTIKCIDPFSGRMIEKKIEAVPDAIDYTWKVTSGNAKLIYDKGPSVVLVHTYGTANTVYVTCTVSDSKKQYADAVPEFYPAMVPPRQKPMAVVGLGDISIPVLPLKHDELENLVSIAVSKFKKAGYDAEGYYRTSEPLVGGFFQNVRMQAVMLVGHAGDGDIVLTDQKSFGYADVFFKVSVKWLCSDIKKAMHPTIREFAILGCESHHEKWLDDFFRLERYHAYRDVVWSASFSSRIVDYVKKFIPSAPRIAPPE